MAQPAALGLKRKCLSCAGAFFDLQHDPIICPKCQAVFTPPPPLPRRPAFTSKIPHPVAPVHAEAPDAAVEDDPEAPAEDDPAVAGENDASILDPDEEPDDDVLPLKT